MLMHVCPAGHEGLMLRHSLISAAGSPGDTWLSEEGFPAPDGWAQRIPTLSSSQNHRRVRRGPGPGSGLLPGSRTSPAHAT